MRFEPNSLPTLIGSLPLKSHTEATKMVLNYTPEIPLWVQLPSYPEERLLSQFSEGLPGLKEDGDAICLDTSGPEFEAELLAFYEDYLGVTEGGQPLSSSRFAMSESRTRGLETLIQAVKSLDSPPLAVKGQITGPFTMLTGLKDQDGKAVFYDQQLRDAVVKMVAMKARFQIERLKETGAKVLIFLDEPALSGFGSSAMVGMSKEEVIAALEEVVNEVERAGGIPGIHVCGNTDWDIAFRSGVEIISFDAYGYLDRMFLFKPQLEQFIRDGGIIAWGLVPTLDPDRLESATLDELLERWESIVSGLSLECQQIAASSLVTPSCGTGLLTPALSEKALRLTRELSDSIRSRV